jgi:hypothetical protein
VRQMITRCPHCGVTLRKFKTPVVLFSPSVAFGRISPLKVRRCRPLLILASEEAGWTRSALSGVTATVESELLRPDRSILRWGSSR